MAGLGGDAVEPSADGGVGGEVEAALAGDVGVGVERDVGDGRALADEPLAIGQVLPGSSPGAPTN